MTEAASISAPAAPLRPARSPFHVVTTISESDDEGGGYDADAVVQCNTDGKSSIFGASFNFVNSIVGAGIIGIPVAIKECGFVFGILQPQHERLLLRAHHEALRSVDTTDKESRREAHLKLRWQKRSNLVIIVTGYGQPLTVKILIMLQVIELGFTLQLKASRRATRLLLQS